MGAVAQQVVVRTLGVDEPGFADVVRLVDDYRVHYRAQSDLDRTERWLRGTASRAQMHCYLASVPAHDVAVGVALVFPSSMTVRLDELWVLRDLYVASGHRGQGVGRALVTRVLDDARAAGVPRISLQTESDNDAARALYRSLGFIAPEGVVALSLAL
jgi:ribosomal protein S18 acetylase RimI-like enzyme